MANAPITVGTPGGGDAFTKNEDGTTTIRHPDGTYSIVAADGTATPYNADGTPYTPKPTFNDVGGDPGPFSLAGVAGFVDKAVSTVPGAKDAQNAIGNRLKPAADSVSDGIDALGNVIGGIGGLGGGGPSAPASTLGDSDFVKGIVNDVNNFTPRTTPTIAAAVKPEAVAVTAPTINQTQKDALLAAPATPTVQAGVVATPDKITQGTGTITAQGATAGQAAMARDVTAQTIDRQMLDTSKSDESRAAFMDALAKVKIAAEGGSPSAAEWLLQKGIDENVGTAYGLAASLQGRNPGLALRTGAITAKDAIAKSAADMAALRADEQAKARGQYGEFARGLNANDIDQSKAQLGADVTVASENAGNALKALTATAANEVTVNVANAATQTAVSIANQTAALDAAKATEANRLAAAIQDSINATTVAIGNRDAALKADDANAARAATMQIAQYQAKIGMYENEQSRLLEAAKQTSINQTQTNIAFSTNQTTRDIAQVEADLRSRGLDDTAINNLRTLGLDAMKAAAADARAGQEIDMRKYAADQAFKAAIVGGAAQTFTSIVGAAT